jgi:hypothetical protein
MLLFTLLFSIADYYCETYGLPEFARKMVYKKLHDSGFDIQFNDFKCGVVNGIILTDVSLKDSQLDLENFLVAKKLRISMRLSFKGSYFIALNSIEIVSGSLKIPLFPDLGDEGKSDIIQLKDVNAGLRFTEKGLNILYFSAFLPPFKFSAYGSFSNVFFSDIFDSDSSIDRHNKSASFTIIPTIKSIAFDTRASFFREFLKIKDHHTFAAGVPECQLMLNIDVLNPERTKIKADLSMPSFKYSSFSVKEVNAHLSYNHEALAIDSMCVNFPNNGKLELYAGRKNKNGLISATLDGYLTSEEISDILKVVDIELPSALQITKTLPFKMKLKNFSMDANTSHGELSIEIPEAEFRGLHIYKIKTQLRFSNDTLSATHLSFETDHNKIKGKLAYDALSQSVDASIQSSGPPLFMIDMMGGENTKMMNSILSRFTFPENDNDIEISAEIHCSWSDKLFYFISGNMVMHSFKYLGIPIKSSDAKIIIDSNELLVIPMIALVQNESLATLSMAYNNSANLKYHVNSPAFKSENFRQGRFILDGQSSLSGDNVLKFIFPDWENEALDLSAPVNAKAAGVIDFSDNPENMTDFKVKILDSLCKWYSMPVEHFDGDLIFKGMDMDIKNATGKVYNGDLNLAYHTNFDTEKGNVKINLKDSEFAPVVKHIKWDLNGEGGKISVDTEANLSYDTEDNLLMTGKGTLKIREANLWEVPLINAFGQLTSKWIGNKWGVITDLDADFQYKKDHIYSNNMHTNGNVVALRSEGKYYWSTGNFNFLVHAEVLKSMLPFKLITKIFDPITGLMETRVIRDKGVIKWQKISWHDTFFNKKE